MTSTGTAVSSTVSKTVLTGFGNQLRRESSTWWSTGKWWRLALLWTGLLGILLTVMLWVVPNVMAERGEDGLALDVPQTAVQFMEMAAVLMATGAIISSQSLLIEDRRSGVMEWILSKPLSRPALVLATFLGHLSGMLVSIVLIPGVAVWALLSIASGAPWPLGRWLGAVAVLALFVALQLALVLALNTFAWSRGVALGIPLLILVASDPVSAAFPRIIDVNPYMSGRIAAGVLSMGQVAATAPLVIGAAATTLLVLLAGWKFSHVEL